MFWYGLNIIFNGHALHTGPHTRARARHGEYTSLSPPSIRTHSNRLRRIGPKVAAFNVRIAQHLRMCQSIAYALRSIRALDETFKQKHIYTNVNSKEDIIPFEWVFFSTNSNETRASHLIEPSAHKYTCGAHRASELSKSTEIAGGDDDGREWERTRPWMGWHGVNSTASAAPDFDKTLSYLY